MPRTALDPRRLQKKTSQTMLAAQRRGAMEANRLSQRLAELQTASDWGLRSWGRDYRQAEQQLSLGNLVLSDHVINIGAISGGRPTAPSADERRRRLAECVDPAGAAAAAADGGRRRLRRRQRRPSSVFAPQVERQRQQLRQQEAQGDQQLQEGPSEEPVPPQETPQPQPVRCLYAGSGDAPCRRFPCCLPQTYSFLSNKQEMLQLYDLLLSHLPQHKRPQSGGDGAASDAGTADLSSMISDAEYLIGAQQRMSTLDPVERARLLRQAVDEWKRKHSSQLPQPRETRYGRPYPMRRMLKPISCSTSFFLN